MALNIEQIKGRLKKLAKDKNADARILIRLFMMERFLERVANSEYADNFIIKGGILVTSMVGISMRSTMDIDASIRNLNLSEEDALLIVNRISSVDLEDGIDFEVKEVSRIMDDREYPGIRLSLNAIMGRTVTPIKIDISTGDIITPRAVEYKYPLMLEERSIRLWSYNLETILAEKLETVLSRGVLNTRMRDFYDIYTLLLCQRERINKEVLKQALQATGSKRGSLQIIEQGKTIIEQIAEDENLKKLWKTYQQKFPYAAEISYSDIVVGLKELYAMRFIY